MYDYQKMLVASEQDIDVGFGTARFDARTQKCRLVVFDVGSNLEPMMQFSQIEFTINLENRVELSRNRNEHTDKLRVLFC